MTIIAGRDLPPLAWQHAEPFDPARMKPITPNESFMAHKPPGGLWTAPLYPSGDTAWGEWCRAEQFGDPDRPKTVIIPDPGATVYRIDDYPSLLRLEAAYPASVPLGRAFRMFPAIDWLKLAAEVDAVWLTNDGQWDTRFTEPGLYGWDCETVFWLQPRFAVVAP